MKRKHYITEITTMNVFKDYACYYNDDHLVYRFKNCQYRFYCLVLGIYFKNNHIYMKTHTESLDKAPFRNFSIV